MSVKTRVIDYDSENEIITILNYKGSDFELKCTRKDILKYIYEDFYNDHTNIIKVEIEDVLELNPPKTHYFGIDNPFFDDQLTDFWYNAYAMSKIDDWKPLNNE